ncbi:MAG: aminoacyl-tRNA hydrolase, partial [Clostridia bacterium]|nr:aminoacyl-tRNA hydrolase [Clostridia bacterium]
CLLMMPQTFMNLSGNAVQKAAKRYGIKPERVLVISDDISFNVGSIRIRKNGSAGGQKGVNNIITTLGTQEFPRIKIGAGKRPEDIETVDWVLGKFDFAEIKTLAEVKENAACAVD